MEKNKREREIERKKKKWWSKSKTWIATARQEKSHLLTVSISLALPFFLSLSLLIHSFSLSLLIHSTGSLIFTLENHDPGKKKEFDWETNKLTVKLWKDEQLRDRKKERRKRKQERRKRKKESTSYK